MSAHLMGLAFKARLGAVNRKVVLLKLCDHAHDDGTNIYPSVARIAHETEVSERTVQRILAGFVETGLLSVIDNESGGRGRTKNYTLCLNRLYELVMEIKGDSVTPFNDGAHPGLKGDSVTPFEEEKGDSVTPFERVKGDKSSIKGDKSALKGDRACHPNPYNHQEPSLKTAQGRERVCDLFEDFLKAYPDKPTMPIEPARAAFGDAVKAGTDPQTLIEAARGYGLRVKADGTEPRYIVNAARWLKERRWEQVATAGPAKPAAKPGVFVEQGTKAFAAWDTHLRNTRGVGAKTIDYRDPDAGPRGPIRRGWWFASQYPPMAVQEQSENKEAVA